MLLQSHQDTNVKADKVHQVLPEREQALPAYCPGEATPAYAPIPHTTARDDDGFGMDPGLTADALSDQNSTCFSQLDSECVAEGEATPGDLAERYPA